MHDVELYEAMLGIEKPWRVKEVRMSVATKEIEVEVECTVRDWGCGECRGRMAVKDYAERRWRHMDSCQFTMWIVGRVPRLECAAHGSRTALVPWAEEKGRFTKLFERWAIDVMKQTSQNGACKLLGITWDEAEGIKERAVRRGLAGKDSAPPTHVCFDEKAIGKGHRYATVAVRVDNGTPTVDYIAQTREQKAADGYWRQWTRDELASVQSVSMDMWHPYAQSVPDVCHIAASAGAHGSIAPSGIVEVAYGASSSFSVVPDSGARLSALIVDGVPVGATGTYVFATVTNDHSIAATFRVGDLPPDPAETAPPPDAGVVSLLPYTMSFLYTGPDAIQTGVDTNALDAVRQAVVRGHVADADGHDLPGVTIAINNRPEFGSTVSRADGMFDMVVNGGGTLSINYTKPGRIPIQRDVEVAWLGYALAPDVVMLARDSAATPISFLAAPTAQVARATAVTDDDGTRRATVFFPPNVAAWTYAPDGSVIPATNLTMRFTEFTVGANGEQAMPAALPPSVAYTYCIELTADEAGPKVNGTDILFDRPVSFYVENFLGMPVGTPVPSAFLDNQRAAWVPEDDGRIIAILGRDGTMATIDADGDGIADDGDQLAALGITPDERIAIARLYAATQSVWRAQFTHFSVRDLNYSVYPFGLVPNMAMADPLLVVNGATLGHPGGEIELENGLFRETLAVPGTPFTLNYSSRRIPDNTSERSISIPLTGDAPDAGIKSVELKCSIAGTSTIRSFEPGANLSFDFTWDGKDVYGRDLVGSHPLDIQIGYRYDATYARPERTRSNFGQIVTTQFDPPVPTRNAVALWQRYSVNLRSWGARQLGFGGWSLDVHHAYDSQGRSIYMGDGTCLGTGPERGWAIFRTIAGTGSSISSGDGGPATAAGVRSPQSVAVGPDGSLYVGDASCRIRRISRDGSISTIAGTGFPGYSGDGGPAASAAISIAASLVVCPDSTIFFADYYNNVVRKIAPNGTISTVVGNGIIDPWDTFGGDDGPALDATFFGITSVVRANDGTLYVGDEGNNRIRKISTDGIVTTIAGTGDWGSEGDGGPAPYALLDSPMVDAIDTDGTIYFHESNTRRLRRIATDGTISTFFNSAAQTFDGAIMHAAIDRDNKIYIARSIYDGPGCVIEHVNADGWATPVAGSYDQSGFSGENGPATRAILGAVYSLAFAPDGTLYAADADINRVGAITKRLDGFTAGDTLVPAPSGSLLYHFDPAGRHLATLDAATGSNIFAFSYATFGGKTLLVRVKDANGNVTRIERASDGTPQAIVAPFGQRTALALNNNGWLESLVNPMGESNVMTYSGGKLTAIASRRGHTFQQHYTPAGEIDSNLDPSGGSYTLDKRKIAKGREITVTTAEGRVSTLTATQPNDATSERTATDAAGLLSRSVSHANGVSTNFSPDGTILATRTMPNPLHGKNGMAAELVEQSSISLPSGIIMNMSNTVAISLAIPGDPFSLVASTNVSFINGTPWSTAYFATNRTVLSISPMGRQTEVVADPQGRPIRMKTPGILDVVNEYDALGRLTKVIQGDRATEFAYGTNGYLCMVVNALGETNTVDTDLNGRGIRATMADGSSISNTYDRSEDPIATTLPQGTTHTFDYTPIGQTKEYQPPAAPNATQPECYTYNRDKQATSLTRPDGTIITNIFDTAGRISQVREIGGHNTAVSYAYDGSGKLSTIANNSGESIACAYDGGLLTNITYSGTISASIGCHYDNNFRISSVVLTQPSTLPSFHSSTSYAYDEDGALTAAGDLAIGYDPTTGFLTDTRTPFDKITDLRSYNSYGEVDQYVAAVSASPVAAMEYARDKLGRITNLSETVDGIHRTHTYRYDAAGRLTRASDNSGDFRAYSYDANGNRTSLVTTAGIVTAEYDAQDRLLRYGDTTYDYNAAGDLTRAVAPSGTTSYDYDSFGNLRQVDKAGGTVVEYVIDPQNRRIGKTVNGSLTQRFVYQDQLKVAAEIDGSGNVVASFVYGLKANVPEYMVKGTRKYRIITDHVGSVRMVLDFVTGEIAQQMSYDEFGNVIEDSNPGFQPFGFQGGLYDRDTQLVRFGARDYDPRVGRWTCKDPIMFAGGFNVYVFCGNDAVNFIDAMGYVETRQYSFEETEDMIRKAAIEVSDENFFVDLFEFNNRYGTAFSEGEYDYKSNTEFANTFMVNGLGELAADQFGNYFAGYLSYYRFGVPGVIVTLDAGHLYALRESGHLDEADPGGSRDMIFKGAAQARLDWNENRWGTRTTQHLKGQPGSGIGIYPGSPLRPPILM